MYGAVLHAGQEKLHPCSTHLRPTVKTEGVLGRIRAVLFSPISGTVVGIPFSQAEHLKLVF